MLGHYPAGGQKTNHQINHFEKHLFFGGYVRLLRGLKVRSHD